MKNKKIYKLGWINVGDKFEFINLKNYRNCSVRRVSDSGCIINAEMRNGIDGIWKSVGSSFSVSNDAEVYLLD